ncbi:MAG TPA: sigma-E processing peptidase SpoIIGA [bacterium]|jgi:stage II sporulation protein GA (sporulation sigma-E factor processing peptidase)|nr:sigma-E processing peptidase SpoIIGA [bacterium]
MRYVYLDVLTVVNVVMNFIILVCTSWLAQIPVRMGRLTSGALLGAAYAVHLILYPTSRFGGWGTKIAVSVLILVAAYYPLSPIRFFRVAGYFYLVSFTLGGAALAVYYLTQGQILATPGPRAGMSWWILAIALAVASALTQFTWAYFKRRRWQQELKTTLIVDWRQRQVKIPGILDSGNMLVDPFTGAPVVVVEALALKGIIPEKIIKLVTEEIRGRLDLEHLEQLLMAEPSADRFRVIPFDSLGHKNALLLGFRPDRVQLEYGAQMVPVPHAVVGLSPGKLSPEGGWRALVSPEVLLPYLDKA